LEYAPEDLDGAVESYRFIMESIGDLAGNHFAPVNKKIAQTGLKFENGKVIFPEEMVKCVEKLEEAGILFYSSKRKHGGLQSPFTIHSMILEILASANPSLCITVGCFNLCDVIEMFGSKELMDEWVPRATKGEFISAMALTEPDYGSNLPELQTRAVKDEKGNWTLTGPKIFITHGCGFADKEALILTLARSKNNPGARGLSFFMVRSKDVEIVRIEEKLGLHASPTCQLSYDNSPAELIGEEGLGLVKYSMAMMNGARLAVASQAVGMAQSAYNEARKYADVRVQFGKLIKEIPAVKRMLENMEMEVMAMRCLLYESSHYVDMYWGAVGKLSDEGVVEKERSRKPEIKYADKVGKLLTPLAKFYTSEVCNHVAYDAIQVLGGAGYCQEYDVAELYCDARIASIYEGTSQLQVVAAIGTIVSGLASEKGIFHQYLNGLLGEIPNVDKRLKKSISELASLVDDYKKLDGELKDMRAWDMVYAAASLVNSLLLARMAQTKGATQNYKAVANRYLVEFLARFEAVKVRIKN
jgi:acyl-CoA dehydrogenase